MNPDQINPKALNRDMLYEATKKVTLGFKCSPSIKLELIKAADNVGVSLSEYVENLVSNSLQGREVNSSEFSQLLKEFEKLKEKVRFYENKKMIDMYHKIKGKTIDYINTDGVEDWITINSLNDVYIMLFSSFEVPEN